MQHAQNAVIEKALASLCAQMPTPGAVLIAADALVELAKLPGGSIDLVIVDPPYFLSRTDGTTVKSGKRVPVSKGAWDRPTSLYDEHWFHRRWLALCQMLLRPSGTLFVSGTHHAIFSIGLAMQETGWHVLNLITWYKANAPPNLGCRQFTHSTEQIIWAAPKRFKPLRHRFNYDLLKAANGGVQMRDLWEFPTAPRSERLFGSHATQKPVALTERVILATTISGELILDPFCGSGSSGVAAVRHDRLFIGIDIDGQSIKTAASRISAETQKGKTNG